MNLFFLGKTDVAKDTVIDRKHHAGVNKACFLFSVDHYDYWKSIYPDLDWNWACSEKIFRLVILMSL
ncbi:hypothetical protein ACU8V7_18455 [Zobellia nedashkovskayae]